jgi:hypothetical protein
MVNLDGSTKLFWETCKADGFGGILKIWPVPSLFALKVILGFGLFEAFLQLYVPAGIHVGPVSPAGNRPVYKVCAFCFLQSDEYYTCAVVCHKIFMGPIASRYCNCLSCLDMFLPVIIHGASVVI